MFAVAAMIADAAQNRRGSIRSARPKTALVTVPKTKPSTTELVKRDDWTAPRSNSARNCGRTAVAENQRASAINWHTVIIETAKLFPVRAMPSPTDLYAFGA